ncbi:MAG TPA: CHAT domain-containing protein [Gemmatimonadaceae bacterium]|nr:CHAT domain-containing protein [Gemmatimonadaceae bacterium]
MRYHDFDLAIDQSADGSIALRSWCDQHGEYHDVATLDADTLAQDRTLLADDEVARAQLIALGTRLYGYTFGCVGRNIEWHFAQCWGAAGAAPNGVRVRLRVAAPNLAVIPWEFIYSERLRGFLGVSDRTPVVRYLELPQAIPSLEATLPVRVLLAIPEQPTLDTATEKREILAALAPLAESVQITVLEGAVSRRRIADALAEHEYHVFHFIGHGDFANDRAVLVMNGADGGNELVDQDRMAGLFRNHPSLKLVVLNSCRGGELSASKPFVGMGAELVKLGIPAVIAMQYEIRDDEAICFARTLYQSLFTGRDRGRIEMAVSHARNALAEEFPDTRAVGLPVLFMHTREGILFNVDTGSALRDLPLSARSAERVKAVIRTHERNLEVLRGGDRTAEHAIAELAEVDALAKTRRMLRFRNLTIVIAVGVALVVGLAASFFGFRAVHPWFRPESYFIAFSDLFHHHDDDASVAYVPIDSATLRAFGDTLDASWRSRHAVVVRRLVAAGAPVIAFNLTFNPQPSAVAANDSLASAFRLARDSGRTIVIAAGTFANGGPVVEPLLAPYVRWGTNCAGDNPVLTAKALTLATSARRAGFSGRVMSLPLTAVAALRAGARGGEAADVAGATRSLLATEVLDSVVTADRDAACAFAPGDTLFRMALDYAPRHEHRDPAHRISYIDAYRGRSLGDLRGRLVLVGNERPGSTFEIVRGWSTEHRFGAELEADAMNTLLRGIRIAPVSEGRQFAAILIMAALGAAAAFLWTRVGRTGAVVSLLLGLVAYFLTGAVLYARQHALLNTFFDLSAILLSFLAVAFTRKVWFP